MAPTPKKFLQTEIFSGLINTPYLRVWGVLYMCTDH